MSNQRMTNRRKRVIVLAAAAACGLVAAGYVVCFERGGDCVAVSGGKWRLVSRVQTGHQRAERLTFADGGRLLAVACPRYDRMVLYAVDPRKGLTLARDWRTAGKPVAVAEFDSVLYVLQRPSGDARHLEPSFWQRYDVQGEPVGERFAVGYDPDDLVFLPAERLALVLLSGNREGESNRPEPSVQVVDVADAATPRCVGELSLGEFADDPARLILSERGSHAGVLTTEGNMIGIDLSVPRVPQPTATVSLGGVDHPRISYSDDDAIALPDRTGSDVVTLQVETSALRPVAYARSRPPVLQMMVAVSPEAGELRFMDMQGAHPIQPLRLRGPSGIGGVRLMNLVCNPTQTLLAASDRSGGVHLVRFDSAAR